VDLIAERVDFLWELKADEYRRAMLAQPKYQDPLRLNKYEAKVYSQAGEDGMLAEVFRRIGTTNKFFVEFGVGTGFENNTVFLLRHGGWTGLWMDGDSSSVAGIRSYFASDISSGKLKCDLTFVTAENIESLLARSAVPTELDLLSIDIDGNDYWIWKKIEKWRPRVVIIEYNAIFPPGVEAVMRYDPDYAHHFGRPWETSSHFGASLKSYELLAQQKGYKLVGCNIGGVDAVFVRADLVGGKFLGPFTAEVHYEPAMYPSQWSKYGAYRRKPL
jgi:hypothetical protein